MKKCILIFIILMILSSLVAENVSEKKVALVLSGGGAKGFAHIGMLKVLDELDIKVDYIFGTSMGAIIGALYASGYSGQEIEDIVVNIDWNSLLTDKVPRNELYVGQKKWLPTGNFFFRLDENFRPALPQGLIVANNIHLQLFYETWRVAHIDNFEDLPIPFKCIGTNVETGKLHIFDSGSISDALRASSSIPSIFMPIDIDGKLFIDGGIAQNFPADVAKDMGMDVIIGFKTNTEMSGRDELTSPIRILNQTINIGMQQKQSTAEKLADILITPNTDLFSILDFDRAEDIIFSGYIEAMRYYDDLIDLSKTNKEKKERNIDFLPDKISFNRVSVLNNRYLSSSAIRDYVNIKTGTSYSRDDILHNFKRAYASELFDQIYPRIKKIDADKYELVIVVNEKERNHLGINLTYNQDCGLVAGAIVSMKNYLLRNSNVLINAQIGGRHELSVDFVKNMLKDYTMYFRFFPYIKEDKIYFYNNNHQKIKSYKALEFGNTLGLGLYPHKNLTIEPYLFHYHLSFYRDIAEEELLDNKVYSTGAGLKLYYENLDKYPYYTKGAQFFLKYSTAKEGFLSELGYKKLFTKTNFALPIDENLSLLLSGEYGTYFKTEPVKEDPFYIGGIDNFLGLHSREISAPFFRKTGLGFRVMPYNNFYIDIIANHVTYGNVDKWISMDETLLGFGLIFGFDTIVAPVRVGLALNQNSIKHNSKTIFTYFSVGYDYDAFFFSKR